MSAARLLSASAAIGIAVIIAGCESRDRPVLTEFVPESDGTFMFQASTGLTYPLNSEDAEATRLRWLDQYIRENSVCSGGEYEVTERTPIFVASAWFEDNYRVIYRGRCLP